MWSCVIHHHGNMLFFKTLVCLMGLSWRHWQKLVLKPGSFNLHYENIVIEAWVCVITASDRTRAFHAFHLSAPAQSRLNLLIVKSRLRLSMNMQHSFLFIYVFFSCLLNFCQYYIWSESLVGIYLYNMIYFDIESVSLNMCHCKLVQQS